MFRGVNAINLDSKGRMAIPTRYRELLRLQSAGQMVITVDTEERCLLLYPLANWEVIEQQIEALPSFNRAARRIQRLLIGHASEVSIDSNGRILLPIPLREYANLQKNTMLVGQGKKFEIWDQLHWEKQCEDWTTVDPDSNDILPDEFQGLSL